MTTLIPKFEQLGSTTNRSFNLKLQETISVKDFGATGDGATDDTTTIQACATYCKANAQILYFPAGVYKITTAIDAGCSIRGDGPTVSVIKNYGTGDALDLSQCNYYETFENFGVDGSGNVASRDGISLFRTGASTGNNVAYCHFFNVYSQNNGRHGLMHRQAWGTRYTQCKFSYNSFLGVYLYYPAGDTGGANGVSFYQCDARWNGGSDAATTYNDDKGGIKIAGAAAFEWHGGIIESNNAWGVNIQTQLGGNGSSACVINNVYGELNGWDATEGGFMYLGSFVTGIQVNESWISYGAQTGKTNYFLLNFGSATFTQQGNSLVDVLGGGTSVLYSGKSNLYYTPLISNILGDIGAEGIASTTTLLTSSDDGTFVISGVINCSRTGTINQHGYYPFIAKRDGSGYRSVQIGASGISAITTPPTISWSGNNLQVILDAYEYGTVTLNPQVGTSAPTTFTINDTVFPAMTNVMRPK